MIQLDPLICVCIIGVAGGIVGLVALHLTGEQHEKEYREYLAGSSTRRSSQ